MTVNCAKTDEPIKMLFGVWNPVDPSKHGLDAGPEPGSRHGK